MERGCQLSSLAHLNLYCNTDRGVLKARRLADGLGQYTSLDFLDLYLNGIGDEVAGRLAEALGQCTSLADLRRCQNEIGDEGAGRLAMALGLHIFTFTKTRSELKGQGDWQGCWGNAHRLPF